MFVSMYPVKESLSFRLAEAADEEPLRGACYAEPTDTGFEVMFRRSLRRQEAGHGYHVLAVEDDGSVVGSGQLVRRGMRVEIAGVVVTAVRRNEGIGSALIDVLEQLAAREGWRPVEIGVTADNVRARALYERLGYVFVKEIVLPDGELAVILEKG